MYFFFFKVQSDSFLLNYSNGQLLSCTIVNSGSCMTQEKLAIVVVISKSNLVQYNVFYKSRHKHQI